MTYQEKLKDPRWQRKRLEVMQYAEFRCQLCGDGKQTLNVHHSYYTREADPWDYPTGSLVCLCESCHEGVEVFLRRAQAFRAVTAGQIPASCDAFAAHEKWIVKLFYHFPEILRKYSWICRLCPRLKTYILEEPMRTDMLERFSVGVSGEWSASEAAKIPDPETQIEDIATKLVAERCKVAINSIPRTMPSGDMLALAERILILKLPSLDGEGAAERFENLECIISNEGLVLPPPK
jgi:hypothetical protein